MVPRRLLIQIQSQYRKSRWKFAFKFALIFIAVLWLFPFKWWLDFDILLRYPRVTIISRSGSGLDIGNTAVRAGLFTPYGLTPGGGEKYFLSVALALQNMGYEVDVLVKRGNVCDKMEKLEETASALRVPLNFEKLRLVQLYQPNRETLQALRYEIFFSLGNSKFPEFQALGLKLNVWMCQFPFDLNKTTNAKRGSELLSQYDITYVNSVYSQGWYAHFIQPYIEDKINSRLKFPVLEILYPPVNSIEVSVGTASRSYASDAVINIVVLGRFFRGRQSKGHDVALWVLEHVMKKSNRKYHLSLIGNIHPTDDAKKYVESLQHTVTSKNLPVTFITNASPEQINVALASAIIMWHLTGMKQDENYDDPASKEHFGIAIAEAMSAGCIPIVTAIGGPSDIVKHGMTGYLASSVEDYVTYTLEISTSSREHLISISAAAVDRSKLFSVQRFIDRFSLLAHRSIVLKNYRQFASQNLALLQLSGSKVVSSVSKYSAIIIETSINPLFEFAVRNFVHFLGPQWALQVYYSERNEQFIRYSLRDIKNIQFKPLPNNWITYLDYDNFLKSSNFWDSLRAEKVLLFQTDSLMVRSGISHFLQYDMIGAVPLNGLHLTIPNCTMNKIAAYSVSVRTVKAMISVCDKYSSQSLSTEREDVFFSRHLPSLGFKLAPESDMQNFFPTYKLAENFKWHLHPPLILHAAWYYINPEDVNAISEFVTSKNLRNQNFKLLKIQR